VPQAIVLGSDGRPLKKRERSRRRLTGGQALGQDQAIEQLLALVPGQLPFRAQACLPHDLGRCLIARRAAGRDAGNAQLAARKRNQPAHGLGAVFLAPPMARDPAFGSAIRIWAGILAVVSAIGRSPASRWTSAASAASYGRSRNRPFQGPAAC